MLTFHINTRIPPDQNFNIQLFLFAHQSHACLGFNLVPPDSHCVLAGSYGKLLGTGQPSISSHRYSPYSLPSGGAGQHGAGHGAPGAAAAGHLHGAAAAAAGHAGGVQYTVASPLMSQLSAGPGQATVLPTSSASTQHQHLEAVAAAGAVQGHVGQATQGRDTH